MLARIEFKKMYCRTYSRCNSHHQQGISYAICEANWQLFDSCCFRFVKFVLLSYRQPEKRSEYQTLVLNDRPLGNALAVFFFRRYARLRLCAYDFQCSIQKRRGKLGRNVSFNESHVLYSGGFFLDQVLAPSSSDHANKLKNIRFFFMVFL